MSGSTVERFVQCDFHDGVGADRGQCKHDDEHVCGYQLPLERVGPDRDDLLIDIERVKDGSDRAPKWHDSDGTNDERDDGRHG
nr:MAG TPA: hypothetical protein [Caudoviricetes sp.]